MKEPTTLSPEHGKAPCLQRRYERQQLTRLTATLDMQDRIKPDTDEFDEARYLVMSLYLKGVATSAEGDGGCGEQASTRYRTPSALVAKRR